MNAGDCGPFVRLCTSAASTTASSVFGISTGWQSLSTDVFQCLGSCASTLASSCHGMQDDTRKSLVTATAASSLLGCVIMGASAAAAWKTQDDCRCLRA